MNIIQLSRRKKIIMSDSMVESESDSENECLAAIEKKLNTLKESGSKKQQQTVNQTKQNQRIQNNVLSEQTQNVTMICH